MVATLARTIEQSSAANTLDEVSQLAQAVYSALLTGTPRRAALMNGSGPRKYGDAPKGHLFSIDDLCDHLAARRTWAVSLADGAGLARAGCRDYDAGGEQAICAALAAARSAGLLAFGIVIEGSGDEHSGGHVWTLYRKAAPAIDIRAQLAMLPGAKGEIYPSGNAIRLPLGLHRRKGTRGTLLLQDGQRYDLDTAHGLLAGLRVMLAMERNAAPPVAPAATRNTSGGMFGTVDLADYASLPDGAALMNAPRYRAMFRFRPQLAKLTDGERVPLPRDGVLDDSDSAQVAVLICNLLTSCKKGQQPGQGAPPLSEIRAIALHWKPALRDGRSLAAYRSQVEYEIARYRPEHYAPEATGYIPGVPAMQPQALAEAAHRGRPAGQRAEQGALLLTLITSLPTNDTGERETTRAQLAQAHGCKADMITLYLRDLRELGAIEQHQTARGMRLVIKSAAIETKEARNRSDQDRSTTPEIAPSMCMEKHTRPLAPCVPASDDEAAALNTSPNAATRPAEIQTRGVCVSLFTLLRTAIRASFDRWQATEKLDRATGELKRCNVTTRRVVADLWAAGLGLAAPDLVEQLIVEERRRREVLALKGLSLDGLRAELRKTEAMLTRAHKRLEPMAWLLVRLGLVQAEMRQRPPEPEPVRAQRRKGGPVCPDQRAAGVQYELELLDLVDAAFDRPAPGQSDQYDALGMIARLKARQAVPSA